MLKGILHSVRWFWNPSDEPRKLYKELKQQRLKIQSLVEEYKVLRAWTDRYTDILNTVTESIDAMIWKKDKDKRYLLANPLHCQLFYSLDNSPECLASLEGKTDQELIQALFRDRGIENTFGEICMLSDDYTEDAGDKCHFIEGGVVDGSEVLLYVIKIPIYDTDHKFNGTIGIAWDVSAHSAFAINQLKRLIYDNRAQKLYRDNNVFVYTFNPVADSCSIFHHICSDPQRDGACQRGKCYQCKQDTKAVKEFYDQQE